MSIENQSDETKTEQENQSESSTGEGSKKESQNQETDVKTFTQEQLNRMMTKEKRQGRASAFNELGINPKDHKAIEKIKALIEGAKTPEQKTVESSLKESEAIREAERKAVIAEAKVEAMRLGVQPQYVDDAIILVTANMGDGDDIKTLIGELKMKHPGWFESETKKDNTGEVGKKGTGTSIQSKLSTETSKDGMAARLASQRKSGQPKSTYWN